MSAKLRAVRFGSVERRAAVTEADLRRPRVRPRVREADLPLQRAPGRIATSGPACTAGATFSDLYGEGLGIAPPESVGDAHRRRVGRALREDVLSVKLRSAFKGSGNTGPVSYRTVAVQTVFRPARVAEAPRAREERSLRDSCPSLPG